MKEIKSVNVFCLGNWNKRIFSPKWVTSNLFGLDPSSQYQGVVNPEEMEFGYIYNDVVILPKSNSLEINLEKINPTSIEFGGVVLERVLNLLPHTPIKAIGINIRYSFKKSDSNPIVKSLNQINCRFNDFSTKQVKFSKELDNCQLNIITDIGVDSFIVNFNFHFINYKFFNKDILSSRIEITKSLINNE